MSSQEDILNQGFYDFNDSWSSWGEDVVQADSEPNIVPASDNNLDGSWSNLKDEDFQCNTEEEELSQPSCIFCTLSFRYLAPHLHKSEPCRIKYSLHLFNNNSASIKEIIKAKKGKKRKSYPSRQQEERRKERRTHTLDQVDLDLLNNFFIKNSEITKVFKCYNCSTMKKKTELTQVEPSFGLPLKYLKNGSYWICQLCRIEPQLKPKQTIPLFCLQRINTDKRDIYVPTINRIPDVVGWRQSHPTVLLPSSSISLSRLPEGCLPRNRPDFQSSLNAEPGQFDSSWWVNAAYETQMKKIFDNSAKLGIFRGSILDMGNNRVTVLPFQGNNCDRIKGTDDYYAALVKSIKFSIHEWGTMFLLSKAEIPKNNSLTWSTVLKQVNTTFTDVENCFDEDGLVETKYQVHPEHHESALCDLDCNIMNLVDYVKTTEIKEEELHSGYLMNSSSLSVQSRFYQLIKLMKEAEDSKASRYTSHITFPLDKIDAEMVHLMWPDALTHLNNKLANKEVFEDVDKTSLTNFWENNITVSNDEHLLGDKFGLPGRWAEEAARLATTFQHHFHDDDSSCFQCFPPNMPSNITLIKEPPRNSSESEDLSLLDKNFLIRQLEEVRNLFMDMLLNEPASSFKSDSLKTLDQFLLGIENEAGFELYSEGSCYKLKFPNHRRITVYKDIVLKNTQEKHGLTPLSAIYHRSLNITCQSGISIVTKRPYLKDMYTMQYKPIFLLATRARCSTELIGSDHKQVVESLVPTADDVPEEIQEYAPDHSEVTMEAALWICDSNKKMKFRSSSAKFVNIKKDKLMSFKEVKNPLQMNVFTDVITGKLFEKLWENHEMYLDRILLLDLCFRQFLRSYDLDESYEENSQGGSPDTNQNIITCRDRQTTESVPLPKTIVLRSGKKLTLRKSDRFLIHETYPVGSEEYMYSQVLFYHPHSKAEDINVDKKELENIFTSLDKEPMQNGAGEVLTKLETVRIGLHPSILSNLK